MRMDLVVFSHLRWNFVYQRPQHLLSRFVNENRVLYIEEPVFNADPDGYSSYESKDKVLVITPHLQEPAHNKEQRLRQVLDHLFKDLKINNYWFWYYTPMYLESTRHFEPIRVVFDCMDELSAFKFAPQNIVDLERELLDKADIVFTGGRSLFEAKKEAHPNIHCFPSSIDREHFFTARNHHHDPVDQKDIPAPKFGFFGVIDERFDIDLLDEVAREKPEWQFIIIGPVVKIDPESLPRHTNIHYLGMKSYQELPAYLSGWDIAIMPFAMNESTRFISPTKTPEYLAAGKPVISTPIHDVVHPYGENNFVHIAGNAKEFIECAEKELSAPANEEWLLAVDDFLQNNSWDITWNKMNDLIKNLKPKL